MKPIIVDLKMPITAFKQFLDSIEIYLRAFVGVFGILEGIIFGLFFIKTGNFIISLIYFFLLIIGILFIGSIFLEHED